MGKSLPWLGVVTGLVLALGGAIGVAQNEQVWLKALFVLVALSGLFCLVNGWRSTRGRARH